MVLCNAIRRFSTVWASMFTALLSMVSLAPENMSAAKGSAATMRTTATSEATSTQTKRSWRRGAGAGVGESACGRAPARGAPTAGFLPVPWDLRSSVPIGPPSRLIRSPSSLPRRPYRRPRR